MRPAGQNIARDIDLRDLLRVYNRFCKEQCFHERYKILRFTGNALTKKFAMNPKYAK